MKKILVALLTLAMGITMTACAGGSEAPELDNKERLSTVLEAFKTNDLETLGMYLDTDSGYQNIIASINEETPSAELWNLANDEIYSKMTYTLTDTDDANMEGFYTGRVDMMVADAGNAVANATFDAIKADVLNGTDTVSDVNTWMKTGIANAGDPVADSHPTMLGYGSNTIDDDNLLNKLTGGLYFYKDLTVTTLEAEGEKIIFIAQGDNLIASVTHSYIEYTDAEAEEMDQMIAALNDEIVAYDGIVSGASAENGVARFSQGIAFLFANTSELEGLGMITGDGVHLSASGSIDGYKQDGFTVTSTFSLKDNK